MANLLLERGSYMAVASMLMDWDCSLELLEFPLV